MSGAEPRGALNLLVLADLHYVRHARHQCGVPQRRADLGIELVSRAVRRARRVADIDAIVLLGDLVDNGWADGADRDLTELRDALAKQGLPVIVVPGNHDGPPEHVLSAFGAETGVQSVAGYQFVTFPDAYGSGDRCVRPVAELVHTLCRARHQAGQPIIALQHNPVHPPIESTYPYMIEERAQVMELYAESGVTLSLSGHYHPGQLPTVVRGVTYATCPALCEAPFRFMLVRMEGPKATVEILSLAMDPGLGLVDHHCHTHYAYCAQDITAEKVIARARDMGLVRTHLTEHAGQLYMRADDFWTGAFITDPDLWIRARAEHNRMPAFRAEVGPLRGPEVGWGLEAECDGLGRLTLADEDRDGWDVLVGALHYLPATVGAGAMDSARLYREFMTFSEHLLRQGARVLAHPFRIIRKAKVPVPEWLFAPLADMLASYGAAAELNFHTNQPDPRFLAQCLERGVRISLGSDSHAMYEVGDFAPHLRLLEDVGVSRDRLPEVLFGLSAF